MNVICRTSQEKIAPIGHIVFYNMTCIILAMVAKAHCKLNCNQIQSFVLNISGYWATKVNNCIHVLQTYVPGDAQIN